MAKKNGSIVYKCSSCSYTQPRWLGRCPECGEWNSMEECIVDSSAVSPAGKGNSVSEKAKPVPLESISAQDTSRFTTGIEEFDRVLGSPLKNLILFFSKDKNQIEKFPLSDFFPDYNLL